MSYTSLELERIAPATAADAGQPIAQALHLDRDAVSVPKPDMNQQNLPDTSLQGAGRDVEVSRWQTFATITTVSGVTGISGLLGGIVVVAVPAIAADIPLESSLLMWPASVYSLTCGCTLLLLGSIADIVGAATMYLIGTALQSIFTLACGLAQTGIQLIVFRALGGVAISFCLPSAVSIITNTFPTGRRRNIGFAAMGGAQAVGFTVGLVLGGVFADGIGWRWSFHTATIANSIVFLLALWGMPRKIEKHRQPATWARVWNDVDWVGALIASASMGMLSYVFASVTHAAHRITTPANISMLSVAILLIPAFIFWTGRQERLGRPAIIPTSLWRNRIFSTICMCVLLTWGQFNAVESVMTFFFQYVQDLSALQTSLRFLGAPIAGTLTNIVMGLVVHKVYANWAITLTTGVSTGSNVLLAMNSPSDTYWKFAAPGIFLNVIGADCLFTISNLIITSVFPPRTQALAGGVFNTIAQIGKSVGLATAAVLAANVTEKSAYADKGSPQALFEGYRAAYWYCFALSASSLILSWWGLKKIGKVGEKKE